ncbi:hypothetical protein RHECIAT_CH0004314 [Rhizobium etli CIAT 652]|uniref:Uncharacterized protein n=1 Tax=Rhizobium etli (strain CIAT 652) TaxID=491916 RepID=B3PR88_RHIE6|nr:hypothetical protein RHECIAT_CH0004314 [Rhizobium etli CIAT 652]KKZ88753.1 hypothetical protein RPHASCH2410_CH06225 [Rhizobium phaseoli Ch24-10]
MKKPGLRAGFFIGTFSRLPRLSNVIADCSSSRWLVGFTAIPSMFGEERIMPFQYCPFGNMKKQVQPGRLSGS